MIDRVEDSGQNIAREKAFIYLIIRYLKKLFSSCPYEENNHSTLQRKSILQNKKILDGYEVQFDRSCFDIKWQVIPSLPVQSKQ